MSIIIKVAQKLHSGIVALIRNVYKDFGCIEYLLTLRAARAASTGQ